MTSAMKRKLGKGTKARHSELGEESQFYKTRIFETVPFEWHHKVREWTDQVSWGKSMAGLVAASAKALRQGSAGLCIREATLAGDL